MTNKNRLINTTLSVALFCGGVTLAQQPVEDINKNIHPYMAAAQHHVLEASIEIQNERKNNKYDMQGHAEKAMQLLVEVNHELKLAVLAADNPKK